MKIFKTVRGQLNFYFVTVFGIILCIFSFLIYTVFANQSMEEFEKAMSKLAISIHKEMKYGNIDLELEELTKEIFIPFSTPKQQFIEIIDENGKFVYKQKELELFPNLEMKLKTLNEISVFENSEIDIISGIADKYGSRVLIYTVTHNSKKYHIVVAVSLSNLEDTLFKFRLLLYVAIPLALILSSILGWIFSRRVYSPVNELIKKSNSISVNNLNERLPVSDSGDEISKLAVTLNNMMERLQNSFLSLKQFTSDASHELKTPLTILQGEIEVALNENRSESEYKRILSGNLEETIRLEKIVDSLLTLNQIESGNLQIFEENINVDELLIEAVTKINYLAKNKNIRVLLKLNESKNDEDVQLIVKGDHGKLLNVFINLLENGIKYSKENNRIICSEVLDIKNSSVIISIQDFGIGIKKENLDKIFNRFYRVDLSRTRGDISGTGLGLTIANTVIKAHHGEINVESDFGKGSTFFVKLPLIADPYKY